MATSPLLLLSIAALLLSACSSGSSGGSSEKSGSSSVSAVKVSGTSHGWVFHDGQTVTVSMGPNKLFAPLSHVNIVQCSDPGGKHANLPTSFIDCDENTIQGDTVVVHAGGSFSESAYTVYKLPSPTLGETMHGKPACDKANPCVLLVSEFQTNLSKPKAFSHPFVVLSAGSSQVGS